MKRLPFLAVALLPFMAHATIHRVNNTGITVAFTTLQDAHDAAADGDTIHLEPSSSTYGNCTFIKPVVVIGPGYFLDLNGGLQATPNSAITGQLIFEGGSEGSVVSGLDVQGQTRVKASFIRLERCRFSGPGENLHIAYPVGGLNLTGIVVNGCFVANNLMVGYSGSTLNDITISNTIARQFNFGTGVTISAEVLHCVATANGTTSLHGNSGILFTNCIFGPAVPGAASFTHCLFQEAPVPATNGNQINVDLSTVFAGGTGDAQYQLATGSPAVGAGVGGVDCGVFAGFEPYVLSGIPPVPSIFSLGAATSIDQGTPLQVTVGARSNQ